MFGTDRMLLLLVSVLTMLSSTYHWLSYDKQGKYTYMPVAIVFSLYGVTIDIVILSDISSLALTFLILFTLKLVYNEHQNIVAY